MEIGEILALAVAFSVILSIVGWLMQRHLKGMLPKKLLEILPLGGHDIAQMGILFFGFFAISEITRIIWEISL